MEELGKNLRKIDRNSKIIKVEGIVIALTLALLVGFALGVAFGKNLG